MYMRCCAVLWGGGIAPKAVRGQPTVVGSVTSRENTRPLAATTTSMHISSSTMNVHGVYSSPKHVHARLGGCREVRRMEISGRIRANFSVSRRHVCSFECAMSLNDCPFFKGEGSTKSTRQSTKQSEQGIHHDSAKQVVADMVNHIPITLASSSSDLSRRPTPIITDGSRFACPVSNHHRHPNRRYPPTPWGSGRERHRVPRY